LIHKLGKNYHFFFANLDSVARVQSDINPFYPFLREKPEALPSITSDPLVIPQFLYNIEWNRISYPSNVIFTPTYIQYTGKKIISQIKLPDRTFYLDQKGQAVQKILSNEFPAPSKLPFKISLDDHETIQIGGIRDNQIFQLTHTKRTKYGSAKYISLRDIVNPNFSEEEVIQKIEELYFDKKSKTYLFRLVKILYSGTHSEEYKIIANLFSYEKEFAIFLSKSMFSAELIPLIHGPFLQNFISSMDERKIKFALPHLSPPVRSILERSVSKNKLEMIKKSPVLKPEPGEGFLEILETELYKKFSRNIYYENDYVTTYSEKLSELNQQIKIPFEDSKKINFWKLGEGIEFYGVGKNKLYFRTTEWIEVLRFDWFISKKEWEPFVFHRLPPDLILEIPFYTNGRFVLGGGISKDRKAFEFVLQWFEY